MSAFQQLSAFFVAFVAEQTLIQFIKSPPTYYFSYNFKGFLVEIYPVWMLQWLCVAVPAGGQRQLPHYNNDNSASKRLRTCPIKRRRHTGKENRLETRY
ncbi:MAG: hypothetical protein Q8N96_06245 [Methylovulum sp.]|nr:hypothetical protein [Methylovulum sp.]